VDKLLITGGAELHGEVVISGAKNAALPEMCATLLTNEPVKLLNMPRLHDVATMRQLLENMGVKSETHGERGGMTLHAATPILPEAPYDLVKTMRASVLVARLVHVLSISISKACKPWVPISLLTTAI
jgi:UDP-N-acetylglucosamine 1-carboxyvinyltransferase